MDLPFIGSILTYIHTYSHKLEGSGRFLNTNVDMVDVVSPYLAELKSSCDLEKIRTFVDSMGLLVSVDCMAGIASTILTTKTSGQVDESYSDIVLIGKVQYNSQG